MRHSLFAVMTALIFTGCLWETEPVHFDRKTFDRERAAWEAAGITDYTVEEVVGYDLAPNKTRVTVRGGVITRKETLSKWDLEHPEDVPPEGPEAFSYVKTVSEVYEWVVWCVEEFLAGADGTRRLWIDISYDTTWHYPVKVSVSESPTEGGEYFEVGGGAGLELSAFTPLPVEGE
jgi:hypothetical protein